MTSIGSNSVSLEAQITIESLRWESLASPEIQSNDGSAFISTDTKMVLNSNGLHAEEDPSPHS